MEKSNRPKYKLIKGEEVVVLTGKSKGSTGRIEKIDYKKGKVFLTGINLYKKHKKPTQDMQGGGIIEKAMPIHISNVMLVDPKSKKPTKVGFKIEQNGKKSRIAKLSKTNLS